MISKERKLEIKAGKEHTKEAERQRNNMFKTMNNAGKEAQREILKKLKLEKSEELPYLCEVCGSSFETPCALSKHQHFFCTGNW